MDRLFEVCVEVVNFLFRNFALSDIFLYGKVMCCISKVIYNR